MASMAPDGVDASAFAVRIVGGLLGQVTGGADLTAALLQAGATALRDAFDEVSRRAMTKPTSAAGKTMQDSLDEMIRSVVTSLRQMQDSKADQIGAVTRV